jgi:hypothetical protein
MPSVHDQHNHFRRTVCRLFFRTHIFCSSRYSSCGSLASRSHPASSLSAVSELHSSATHLGSRQGQRLRPRCPSQASSQAWHYPKAATALYKTQLSLVYSTVSPGARRASGQHGTTELARMDSSRRRVALHPGRIGTGGRRPYVQARKRAVRNQRTMRKARLLRIRAALS